MQKVVGSSTAILFIFDKKLSLNSVKTFRENSNEADIDLGFVLSKCSY